MKGGEQMNYEQYRKRYREQKTGFSFWLDKEKDADIINFLRSNNKTETIKKALKMLMKKEGKKC
jgi:hypothetical protein